MAKSNALLNLWQRLSPLPGGAWLFSQLLGQKARYTGSIRPRVRELGPGHALIKMSDRARVRNHLHSIHAVALINLGEVTGGIALLTSLPKGRRGIVTELSMKYFKKARGPLFGRADFTPPPPDFEGPFTTETEVIDSEGDVVAVATAEWTLGPDKR